MVFLLNRKQANLEEILSNKLEVLCVADYRLFKAISSENSRFNYRESLEVLSEIIVAGMPNPGFPYLAKIKNKNQTLKTYSMHIFFFARS